MRDHLRRAPEASEQLEAELWCRLIEYGLTSDERMVEPLTGLYSRAVDELPPPKRLDMLLAIIERVEARTLSGNAFMPFIFRDMDPAVISTAALHAAGVWPGTEGDPMLGVRELAGFARKSSSDGNATRAAAIFAALVLLGDRRAIQSVGPCWRSLSPEGRQLLAQGIRGRVYSGVVDWLISWLEECEGGEFGAVAAALAVLPKVADPPEVIEVHRTIPIWAAADGIGITVTHCGTVEAYGERIRPRLLQIAADEQAPRVMHDVLKEWGINHTRRHLHGVVMRPDGTHNAPRPLLPLLGASSAGPSRLTERVHPLENEEFVTREGRLLLSWATFNPYGPTWSCLGLLPTEDAAVKCLFYRMLNPFRQQSGIVGMVRDQDSASGVVLGQQIELLFAQECNNSSPVDSLRLVGDDLPDVIRVMPEDPEFIDAVRRAFLSSPRLRELDVARAASEIREFRGRPWDRASARLKNVTAQRRIEDFSFRDEGHATDEAIDEWLGLVAHPDHWLPDLLNFPSAWHGSIDYATPLLAQRAFTFWQLDDFLARYGDPTFRQLAKSLGSQQARGPTEKEGGVLARAPLGAPDEDGHGTDVEPNYREVWTQFQEWYRVREDRVVPPVDLAYGVAGWALARQLAAAEQEFEEAHKDADGLRRLMRMPWVLGYLLGAAFAVIERFEIRRDSHDADVVVGAIHRLGLGRIATQDALALTHRASAQPEFSDGMLAAGQDVIGFANRGEEAAGLLCWLCEQA